MTGDNKPKSTWDYIRIYFPDIWQYIVIIITIIIAAIFIL
jgi:hypothetical protein